MQHKHGQNQNSSDLSCELDPAGKLSDESILPGNAEKVFSQSSHNPSIPGAEESSNTELTETGKLVKQQGQIQPVRDSEQVPKREPIASKSAKIPDWKPFKPVKNAKGIAEGLKQIPEHWSLTPVQHKSPMRPGWQIEESVPHTEIANLILHGEPRTSKNGKRYTHYWSGYGVRTGDFSDGITAIDVDGASAQPLLEALANGDLPETVSWTSGKPGRYQIAYQVPEEIRPLLSKFKRSTITELGDLRSARDEEGKPSELLEFRYNGVQSVLPPSRHPQTGSYQWINSPDTTEVAPAPKWLCDLLVQLASKEKNKVHEDKERAANWAEAQKQAKYQGGVVTDLVDFLNYEVLPKLSREQIFCYPNHNFREYGNTYKGNPPWRESVSGTSFHVWWDGSTWAWVDKATNEGGSALQYRWKLKGGIGVPRGKDFVNLVKELAAEAGVEMPERPKPEYDPDDPEGAYKPVCKEMKLPYENCVTAVAFDTWVFKEIFTKTENWRTIDAAFYKWSDEHKYWQHQPDNRINTIIADAGAKAFKLNFSMQWGWRVTKPYGTDGNKKSAFGYVRSRLERPEPLPANTHLLGFKNCVVDLRTGQQMPHEKDYFLTNCIPNDYEAGKPCPEVFYQFIVESFGEDMVGVIRAFTSMFLDPTAPYGRFPHLIGQSGGGKGTLGRFWGSLFGSEGSGSAAQFADISTPEGRHQFLTGKRIFGFPDVGGFAEGVRAFYELTDNGTMSGRALFNPVAYSKQWYMRFWIASVDHLQIENAGDGWARRAYPIPVVSRTITPDPDLWRKLEECKADVISWALAMPREERDRILLSPPESERAINLAQDAAIHGDSTKSFVHLCLRPSPSSVYVENHQLHSWYVAYCREHGCTPLAMSKFINHLKTVLPRNYQDRHWAPMIKGQPRQRIQAHWQYICPLEGVFFSEPTLDDNVNWNESTSKTPTSNPTVVCIKRLCVAGGLEAFEEFWQPKFLEPIHSQGVQVVQGELDKEKKGGQAETLTQSDCPNCPTVQGESLHARTKKSQIPNTKPSNEVVVIQESGIWDLGLGNISHEGKVGVDKLDNLDTRATQGFQPVQGAFENLDSPGHPGQVDVVSVPAISAPKLTLGVRVKVDMPGSKRDKKMGTVKFIDDQRAIVLLDDSSLGDLRVFDFPFPGTDLMRLEVL